MKITKKRLKEIVSEELKKGLKEAEDAAETPEMKNARSPVELTLTLMQNNSRIKNGLAQIKANPTMKAQFLAKINGLMGVGEKDAAMQTQKTTAQQRALTKAPSGTPGPVGGGQ